jgi:hypothetical protein
LRPKLAQWFKHTPKLRKLSYRFQNRRYLSELILKRLYLLKHRLYRERGVKRNLLICHSSLSSQQQQLLLTVDSLVPCRHATAIATSRLWIAATLRLARDQSMLAGWLNKTKEHITYLTHFYTSIGT